MAESLKFARSLYAPEAVDEAVAAFSELAKLTVQRHDSETEIVVSDPDPEVADVLLDEIANHVLYQTIARHRGT